MRLFGMIAAALALAGCVQQPVVMNRAPAAAGDAPMGYLVGTIGRAPNAAAPRYEISICNRDFGRIAAVQYKTAFLGMEPRQIDEEDFMGESFALALPAGDYTICESSTTLGVPKELPKGALGITKNRGQTGWHSGPVSIALKVEAGKVSYIGRYKNYVNRVKILGVPGSIGTFWVVLDQQAADLPQILKRDPTLANLPVVPGVPPKDQLPGPLFLPELPADYKNSMW